MTNRAHRERRQRTTRKTTGPAIARAHRRRTRSIARGGYITWAGLEQLTNQINLCEPHWDSYRRAMEAVAVRGRDLACAITAALLPNTQAAQIMYQQGRAAGLHLVPFLTETGAFADGEYWPDAHRMRHDLAEADSPIEATGTIAERRARLDAWLEASGDVLDEQAQVDEAAMDRIDARIAGWNTSHGLIVGDARGLIANPQRVTVIPLDDQGQPTGPGREIPFVNLRVTADGWVEGYIARTQGSPQDRADG